MMKKRNTSWSVGLASLLLAFLLLSYYSPFTSPFYSDLYGVDSSFFRVIGKVWAEGGVPYQDAWDSKGPIIFLVSAISYYFTQGTLGIFVQQVIALGVTIFIFYHWFYRASARVWVSCLLTLGCMVGFVTVYEGGNCVEEFCLPFLAASFYGMYRWWEQTRQGKWRHSYRFAFLYGIAFGVCAMTRLTNALGLCAGVLVVATALVFRGGYKALLLNALSMLFGALVIILPFVLYFGAVSSVNELWYGTIGYNLDYASHPTSPMSSMDMLLGFRKSLTFYSYLLMVASLVLLVVSSRRRLLGVLGVAVSFPLFWWFCHSNGYAHYAIISIASFPLLYSVLRGLYESSQEGGALVAKRGLMLFVIGVAGFAVLKMGSMFRQHTVVSSSNEDHLLSKYDEFIDREIPPQERDAVQLYELPPAVYLYSDITPCYRFFTLQEFVSNQSGSFRDRFLAEYATCRAKYILVGGASTLIQPILQERYTLTRRAAIDSQHEVTLYVRKH